RCAPDDYSLPLSYTSHIIPQPPLSILFPYTTLFRSHTHLPKYLDYYTVYKPAKPLLWWYIRRNHKNADINLVTSRAIRDDLDAEGIKRLDNIPRGVDVIIRHRDVRSSEKRDNHSGRQKDEKMTR